MGTLLRVGSPNPALGRIETELEPVHPPDPVGHDGQLTYLIARDPFGIEGTPAIISAIDNNGPAYRYRPYVAVADLAFQHKVTGGVALLAMINAGMLKPGE